MIESFKDIQFHGLAMVVAIDSCIIGNRGSSCSCLDGFLSDCQNVRLSGQSHVALSRIKILSYPVEDSWLLPSRKGFPPICSTIVLTTDGPADHGFRGLLSSDCCGVNHGGRGPLLFVAY